MYVFHSVNGGASWTQTLDVATDLACTGPAGITADKGIPLSRSLATPDHLSMQGSHDPENVWLSRDGGVNWTNYINLADPMRAAQPGHHVAIYPNGIYGFAEPPTPKGVPSRLATIVG